MSVWSTVTNYDSSAVFYDQLRIPGQSVIKALKDAFKNVSSQGRILSLGCGTGQYESSLSSVGEIVGLDQSREMLNIAAGRVELCLQANMLELPFPNSFFHGAYFVHSFHHVCGSRSISHKVRNNTRKEVLKEVVRVLSSGPLSIVQRDPSQSEAIWFWRYFPRALETKLILQPKVSTLVKWLKKLGLKSVSATPIDEPMIQGFYQWDAPLNAEFRESFSEFSYLNKDEVEQGMEKLIESKKKGLVKEEIEQCRARFASLGGTTFIVSGEK